MPSAFPSIRRFALLGSKKNWDRGGALTSGLQSFEAELLASEENLLGLMTVNRELVAQVEAPGGSGANGGQYALWRPKRCPPGGMHYQRDRRKGRKRSAGRRL